MTKRLVQVMYTPRAAFVVGTLKFFSGCGCLGRLKKISLDHYFDHDQIVDSAKYGQWVCLSTGARPNNRPCSVLSIVLDLSFPLFRPQ